MDISGTIQPTETANHSLGSLQHLQYRFMSFINEMSVFISVISNTLKKNLLFIKIKPIFTVYQNQTTLLNNLSKSQFI